MKQENRCFYTGRKNRNIWRLYLRLR